MYYSRATIIAKLNYDKASKIKPDEQYPKNKIQEIDKIVEDSLSIEDLYNKIIADADKKLDNKDYDAAIERYKNALTYKPDEKYPEIQITKINYLKVEKSKLEVKYLQIITVADKFAEDKEYSKAKITYSNALELKPDENYPKSKIQEIDKILSEKQNKLQTYSNIIEAADDSMNLYEYSKAKELYVQASNLELDDLILQG